MVAACAFDFHRVDGQTMVQCVPDDAIHEEESKLVSYHAFPDNLSLELHNHSTVRDSVFFFRISRIQKRENVDERKGSFLEEQEEDDTKDEDETNGCTSSRSSYLYGYVFCRQRQDPNLPRGGEQKSVVILTEVPRGNVLKHLVCIAGKMYFDYGPDALEEVIREVGEKWESPRCGKQLSLGVCGFNITATLPPASSLPPPFPDDVDRELELLLQSPGGSGGTSAAFSEANIHESFKGMLDHLWTLWELALLGEPLIVVAPSSYLCSEAVASLLSIISPLPYFGEIRPYFTIHDPYFHTLRDQVAKGCIPGGIFGITNLVVLKSLQPWPHVVSIGDERSYQSSVDVNYFETQNNQFGENLSIQALESRPLAKKGVIPRLWGGRSRDATSLISTYQEKLWSSYQPCTKKNDALLNRIRSAKTASVANLLIRQHFGELTRRFLEPFTEFFQLSSTGSAGAGTRNSVRMFNEEEYLDKLGSLYPSAALERNMKSKSSLKELYKRFVRSTNFLPWLTRRQVEIEMLESMKAGSTHAALDSICRMSEVELVDLMIKLQRQLNTSGSNLPEMEKERLLLALEIVHKALPTDLKESLNLTNLQVQSP